MWPGTARPALAQSAAPGTPVAAAVGRGCFGCQEPLAEQLDRGIDVVDDAGFGLQVCGPHIHVEQPCRMSTQHQGPQGEQGQRPATRAWLADG